uniref:Uncharacterized protein n=1 Tax=Pipistrellus kuhlii TaxID=59472 RepID=A0A7J7UTP8_PIPKU|nr:hypothetical protein mPipKuh1_008745 [Pipistrellus kuhlii]
MEDGEVHVHMNHLDCFWKGRQGTRSLCLLGMETTPCRSCVLDNGQAPHRPPSITSPSSGPLLSDQAAVGKGGAGEWGGRSALPLPRVPEQSLLLPPPPSPRTAGRDPCPHPGFPNPGDPAQISRGAWEK